jgi:hypothetical protein
VLEPAVRRSRQIGISVSAAGDGEDLVSRPKPSHDGTPWHEPLIREQETRR